MNVSLKDCFGDGVTVAVFKHILLADTKKEANKHKTKITHRSSHGWMRADAAHRLDARKEARAAVVSD